MRRKYRDCQRQDGNCTMCSLVNGGLDCHNCPITKLEWARRGAGLTQQQLANVAVINIRLIQKVEGGEAMACNLTAKNLLSIAKALDVSPYDLV